jgi:hypothetical protein
MNRRWRLILAALAFVGWLSYLGYAALSKNHGPVISRAQAAAAKYAVVAEVEAGADGVPLKQVKVVRALSENGPKEGTQIDVENLPRAKEGGFTGPGEYLLLLTEPPYLVVGQQRSPGNNLDSSTGPPLIYPWNDGVRKQFEKLPR